MKMLVQRDQPLRFRLHRSYCAFASTPLAFLLPSCQHCVSCADDWSLLVVVESGLLRQMPCHRDRTSSNQFIIDDGNSLGKSFSFCSALNRLQDLL